jgi:hypothetical protein
VKIDRPEKINSEWEREKCNGQTGDDDGVSQTQGWDDTSRTEIRRKVTKFLRTQ